MIIMHVVRVEEPSVVVFNFNKSYSVIFPSPGDIYYIKKN